MCQAGTVETGNQEVWALGKTAGRGGESLFDYEYFREFASKISKALTVV